MSIAELGCCGAYCRTCPARRQNACRGCKLGYESGERELAKAKCKIKVCCMGKGYTSCADCTEYDACNMLQGFYNKNEHTRHRHAKYKQALDFIRENGYAQFIELADGWKCQYGKLDTES
jgi:hypothetical protein